LGSSNFVLQLDRLPLGRGLWQSTVMADPSRGDWQCPNEECYNHTNFPDSYVYGSNMNCKKCGTGKSAQRAGDWCCPNQQCVNSKNCVYGSKYQCPKCGCPKPPVGTGKDGFGKGKGAGMGKGKGKGKGKGAGMGMGMMGMMDLMRMPTRPLPALPMRNGDWHCPNAYCKNHSGSVVYSSKSTCPLCGANKPEASFMGAMRGSPYGGNEFAMYGGNEFAMYGGKEFARGKGGRPGDWNCPNPECKNHLDNVVYGSKDHCPLCATPKPETGARVARMRPGDWHCSNPDCKNHTANVVYANKTHCPLCNDPRPGLDERARSRSPRSSPF